MKDVKTKSYTIYDNNGSWLGQIILSADGMFCSVTDYGNLSYSWRAFGENDFRKFLTSLNTGYFGTKMYSGMSYILYGKKCEQACNRFAEKILPALQDALKLDMETNPEW